MKKIDLNFKVKDPISGTEPDDRTVGKIVASILLVAVLNDEKKIMKYYDWAQTLAKDKPLELDEADCLELKEFLLASGQIFVLAKAPLIKLLS